MSAAVAGVTVTAKQLEMLVEDMTISRYLLLAGFAVLVYDHFLTISEEVEYIWKRPKNVISWIFFFNRYFTPIVLGIDGYDKLGFATGLTQRFCQTWVITEVVLHLLTSASVHALVVIRVNALYGNTRFMRFFLGGIWAVYLILSLSISLAAVAQQHATFHPDPVLHSCVGYVGHFVFWVWVPPLLLEFVLFGMTVAKAVSHSKRNVASLPIVRVLYRDGFNYFMIISLCSVFNLVVWKWAPITFFALAKYFTIGMVNAMGARMVLNLRQLGGVRANASPPTLYFVQAVPQGSGFLPNYGVDSETKHIWTPEAETPPERMSGELPPSQAISLPRLPSPSRPKHQKKPKADPYFYQRQASQLRALRVERSEWNLASRARSPIQTGGAFLGSSQIEEVAATGGVAPMSGRARSHRTGSVASGEFIAEPGSSSREFYNLETWSVSTVAIKDPNQKRDPSPASSSGDSRGRRSRSDTGYRPPWSYV